MSKKSNMRNYDLYLEICKPEIHEPQGTANMSVLNSFTYFDALFYENEMDKLLDVIKEQREKIKELKTMINYMPNGPGYESAKKSFEGMIEKNNRP